MDPGIILLYAAITILSLIMFCATIISYVKYKNKKLLFVSSIFLVLLIRGILLSVSMFYDPLKTITSNGYIWIVDVLVLLFLYAAYSVKR
jgi:hypothetical protein